MAEFRSRQWTLFIAITVTTAGILRVGMFPSNAPSPRLLDPEYLVQLQSQGWQLQSTVAAKARAPMTNAEGVVLVLPQSATAVETQLTLVPIRARSADQLGADTILTTISGNTAPPVVPKQSPALAIQGATFLRFSDPIPGGKQRLGAASCIAGGKVSSIDREVASATGKPPSSWSRRVETTLGLKPLRDWSCLFVTISVRKDRHAEQSIKKVWTGLSPVLTAR